MQYLTGTMITNPRHEGPEQDNRPEGGPAGPVTGNRYRGAVRGGRVTGQGRTAQDRGTSGVFARPPGRRDHSGKRPLERPLGPLTRDAGPLARTGAKREWAA